MVPVTTDLARQRAGHPFQPGPAVAGHRVQYDEDRHFWVIDELLIVCSVLQYHCLKMLLEEADRCVPFDRLLTGLPGSSPSSGGTAGRHARARLAHLVSRVRAKIWASGLEIVSVVNVGYLLRSGSPESPPPQLPGGSASD